MWHPFEDIQYVTFVIFFILLSVVRRDNPGFSYRNSFGDPYYSSIPYEYAIYACTHLTLSLYEDILTSCTNVYCSIARYYVWITQ